MRRGASGTSSKSLSRAAGVPFLNDPLLDRVARILDALGVGFTEDFLYRFLLLGKPSLRRLKRTPGGSSSGRSASGSFSTTAFEHRAGGSSSRRRTSSRPCPRRSPSRLDPSRRVPVPARSPERAGWRATTPGPITSPPLAEKLGGNWATLNPADAARIGVAEGERVRVESPVGALEIEARLSPDIREGVVAIHQFFGHNYESGTRASRRFPGVNVNLLHDDRCGPLLRDAGLQRDPLPRDPAFLPPSMPSDVMTSEQRLQTGDRARRAGSRPRRSDDLPFRRTLREHHHVRPLVRSGEVLIRRREVLSRARPLGRLLPHQPAQPKRLPIRPADEGEIPGSRSSSRSSSASSSKRNSSRPSEYQSLVDHWHPVSDPQIPELHAGAGVPYPEQARPGPRSSARRPRPASALWHWRQELRRWRPRRRRFARNPGGGSLRHPLDVPWIDRLLVRPDGKAGALRAAALALSEGYVKLSHYSARFTGVPRVSCLCHRSSKDFMSPRHFRELALPSLSGSFTSSPANITPVLHCDGNWDSSLDDLHRLPKGR